MKNFYLLLLIHFSLLFSPLAFLTQKSYSYQLLSIRQNTAYNFPQESLDIIENQVILSPIIQKKLTPAIAKAQEELEELSKRFSIDFTQEFGIIYIHQGQEDWLIKFTYGSLILDFPDEIILSTPQIFTLKKAFEQTPLIEIVDIQYPTTQSMRQVGPILHEE